MTVSIIIAVKTWQKNLEECVAKCLELDYPDFEIIVLPDEAIRQGESARETRGHPSSETTGKFQEGRPPGREKGTAPVKIIPTGPVNPARKRDIAIKYARGDILAFIDDDVYPHKDWLKNAVANFNDLEVAAVGGPAITPQEDNFKQRASGAVYSSWVVSGKYVYRYLPRKKIEVEDYPSCNFLVRRSVMEELGGFNTDFWPGEDTKLCLDITRKIGRKILYDPQTVVYHHRREIFIPHLKQIANYALHRGYFVKRYPETSLRAAYFVPSLFLLGVIGGGIAAVFFVPFKPVFLAALCLYLTLVLISSISNELCLIPLVFSGIIISHCAYGFYFLIGLLSNRLKEDSRQ